MASLEMTFTVTGVFTSEVSLFSAVTMISSSSPADDAGEDTLAVSALAVLAARSAPAAAARTTNEDLILLIFTPP
jgi:hypothetical protein